jgi:uncharacterized membrane protein
MQLAPRTIQLPWITRRSLSISLPLSAIALFFLSGPRDLLTKANLIGFATCHRIPERSFCICGSQLPLCARCTGIYIGLLTGWTFLAALRRTRAAQLPPRPITIVLVGFILLMGFDGLNSTVQLIPGAPYLYVTENWMRALTGSLYGIATSMLLTPYITMTMWREPSGDRTLKGWGELLLVVNVVAVLVMLVLTEASFLLWPLVVLSMAGVIGLMALMNTSIVIILFKRVNVYAGWRDLSIPLMAGVALALVEFVALGAFRAAVLPLA